MKGWIVYLVGVAAVHATTLIRWMRSQQPDAHRNMWAALGDFYFGSKQAQYTTFTVGGIIWIIGAMIVDHIGVELLPIIGKIPTHPAWCFTFGTLGELAAPKLIRWVLGLLPGGDA